MTAAFLTAEELDAAPLGSFIPMYDGSGRWVRVDGGWRFQWTWISDDGKQNKIVATTIDPTLDAIRRHELRRASTVFIEYRSASSAWHQIPCWIAVCSSCNWHAYLDTLPAIHSLANDHVQAVCRVAA